MTLPIAYRGSRTGAGNVVEAKMPGGAWFELDPRLDLGDHSHTGFEWGYPGIAPAQLALALAASRLPAPVALAVYQELKHTLVAKLASSWQLDGACLDELLAQATHRRDRSASTVSTHGDDGAGVRAPGVCKVSSP